MHSTTNYPSQIRLSSITWHTHGIPMHDPIILLYIAQRLGEGLTLQKIHLATYHPFMWKEQVSKILWQLHFMGRQTIQQTSTRLTAQSKGTPVS